MSKEYKYSLEKQGDKLQLSYQIVQDGKAQGDSVVVAIAGKGEGIKFEDQKPGDDNKTYQLFFIDNGGNIRNRKLSKQNNSYVNRGDYLNGNDIKPVENGVHNPQFFAVTQIPVAKEVYSFAIKDNGLVVRKQKLSGTLEENTEELILEHQQVTFAMKNIDRTTTNIIYYVKDKQLYRKTQGSTNKLEIIDPSSLENETITIDAQDLDNRKEQYSKQDRIEKSEFIVKIVGNDVISYVVQKLANGQIFVLTNKVIPEKSINNEGVCKLGARYNNVELKTGQTLHFADNYQLLEGESEYLLLQSEDKLLVVRTEKDGSTESVKEVFEGKSVICPDGVLAWNNVFQLNNGSIIEIYQTQSLDQLGDPRDTMSKESVVKLGYRRQDIVRAQRDSIIAQVANLPKKTEVIPPVVSTPKPSASSRPEDSVNVAQSTVASAPANNNGSNASDTQNPNKIPVKETALSLDAILLLEGKEPMDVSYKPQAARTELNSIGAATAAVPPVSEQGSKEGTSQVPQKPVNNTKPSAVVPPVSDQGNKEGTSPQAPQKPVNDTKPIAAVPPLSDQGNKDKTPTTSNDAAVDSFVKLFLPKEQGKTPRIFVGKWQKKVTDTDIITQFKQDLSTAFAKNEEMVNKISAMGDEDKQQYANKILHALANVEFKDGKGAIFAKNNNSGRYQNIIDFITCAFRALINCDYSIMDNYMKNKAEIIVKDPEEFKKFVTDAITTEGAEKGKSKLVGELNKIEQQQQNSR